MEMEMEMGMRMEYPSWFPWRLVPRSQHAACYKEHFWNLWRSGVGCSILLCGSCLCPLPFCVHIAQFGPNEIYGDRLQSRFYIQPGNPLSKCARVLYVFLMSQSSTHPTNKTPFYPTPLGIKNVNALRATRRMLNA